MPFPVPTFEQIRDQYLIAVRNQHPDAATGTDSDNYVRACAIASVAEGLYAHQVWAWRQAYPDLCDEDILEKMAAQRGVPRKVASYASGTVRLAGTPGTIIPAGQGFATAVAKYETTASCTITGSGSVDVTAVATVLGQGANVSAPIAAQLSGAPGGVATATVQAMSGGADAETAAALLERLLAVQSQPAQGGNENDYKVWALEVPGVRRAFVFPLRRGVGTVDVVPMPASGLPSAQLLADVQAHIDALKPVGMSPNGFLAVGPTRVTINVTGVLQLESGVSLAQVLAPINSALARIFYDLAPGDTLHLARLIAAIVNVVGVKDVALTSPAGNITPTVNGSTVEMVDLGAVSLED